jgi:hypothetical protein
MNIPKEDGIQKRVKNISENDDHTYIEAYCSDVLINDVESYDYWLLAFKEHYDSMTMNNSEYDRIDGIQTLGMNIPIERRQIYFEVDYSHNSLKFYINEKDEQARNICFKFMEKLF